ncbi:MAG TPA: NDP-sugar synthase [Acidimicrobiales bacterium]
MRAVVLVGGFGTRLRPLTYTTPKPLLPVGHRPMLELVLGNLARAGIEEAVLSLGFRPDVFGAAYPDGMCAGVHLNYAVEPEPLDTAGAIRFAARHAEIDDTFVVVNGDVLTDLDVAALAAFHRLHAGEGTIHLTAVEDPSAFGVVAADEAGRVLAFIEKPPPESSPTNLVNAGTYVLEPSVLERIPGERKVSIERETFPAMVADGRLFAMATDDYWLDTGRPDLFLLANLDLLDGRRRWDRCEGVASEAVVDPLAEVLHSVIGAGAEIGPRARVVDSVLLPGARVGAGAEVCASVLAGGAVVGEDAVVRGSVIGDGYEVPAREVLVDARVPA